MREYGLNDAVSSFSHYSSTINSLWGIYVVATFTAAGFGISLQNEFNDSLAALLSIGFLAFTLGHLSLILFAIRIQNQLKKDILAYLPPENPEQDAPATPRETADQESARFAKSIRAICEHQSRYWASIVAHVIIDSCVLMIIWSRATGFDPLNLVPN